MFKVRDEVIKDSYIQNKLLWINEVKDLYSESTKQVYFDYLNLYTIPTERAMGKDLYNFTRNDIVELMKNSPKLKRRNVSTLWCAVNGYMKWANTRGLCPLGNPCDSLDMNDFIDVNVDAVKDTYIKLDEFWEKINRYEKEFEISSQNLIILVLYRYGIMTKNIKEVKYEDVDRENHILNVYNQDRTKLLYVLPIDDNFIKWVDKANDDIGFDYRIDKRKLDITVEYNDTGYILKTTSKFANGKITRDNDDSDKCISNATLYNRYNSIFETSKDLRMKMRDLNNSRKYDILYDIYDTKGELSVNDLETVNKMFTGKTATQSLKEDFQIISGIHILSKFDLK